jgi:hypothetical protein
MKTDKTGIEEIRDRIRALDMPYSTWEIVRNLLDGLIASEKPAMEKAQGQQDGVCGHCGGNGGFSHPELLAPIECPVCKGTGKDLNRHPQSVEAPKPINPVVAKHNEALGPLRLALWELVEEIEYNIRDSGNYSISAVEWKDSLGAMLEKNPPEQRPTCDKCFDTKIDFMGEPCPYCQGNTQKHTATASLINLIQGIMQKALNGGHTLKECEMLKKYLGEILSAYQAGKPTADKGLWDDLNDLYEKSLYHPGLALKVMGAFDVKDLLLKHKEKSK